ncbi:DUF3304 domain-containing protein [Cupriavidus campinensis]|uniref:DUF3304 domain-containing protein n=2 Tax=Cupriavidus TaxID=106589 RepID=UPI0011EC4B41|nr:DUF3304 domain-containing protein [Cupriavidus campinensis]
MPYTVARPRAWIAGLLAALPLAMSGCGEEPISVSMVGYNHTDVGIYAFEVNGRGGPNIWPHEGGGSFTCCVTVPRVYKPGMTAKVRWVNRIDDVPQERIVPVPPYGPRDGGMFAVHFLRDGNVKVFVTMMGLGHPDYPLKGDEARK